MYSLIFSKFDLQIVYVFLVNVGLNQVCSNLIKQFSDDNEVRNILIYLVNIVIIVSVMIYIKKTNKEEIYRRMITALPRKLYILILVLLLIASIFVMAATRDDTKNIIQYVLLPSMIGLVLSTICLSETSIPHISPLLNNIRVTIV